MFKFDLKKLWQCSCNKILVGIIVLLIALVICGLPSNQMKNDSCKEKHEVESKYISSAFIERLAKRKFTAWAESPIVIKAVKEANSENPKTLQQIIDLDNKWITGSIEESFVDQLLNNECAEYLRKLQSEGAGHSNLYSEIFVIDKQGCVVAETNITTDYWQGDEEKFIKSYANGQGKIFIDKTAHGESTSLPLVQVSVPVMDPDTHKAIGVMTIGLNICMLPDE